MTKHYKQLLLPLHATKYGKITTGNGEHWLVNKDDEVACLPHHLWLSLEGYKHKSSVWGPYVFYNNFELTQEAQYLKQMFRHMRLTPAATKKVYTILRENSEWVEIEKTLVQALAERENDNDCWLKEIEL